MAWDYEITLQDKINSIMAYASSDTAIYQKLQLGTATIDEVNRAFTQIPQMQIVKSVSGRTLSVQYADPVRLVPSNNQTVDEILEGLNSNAGYNNGNLAANGNFPVSVGGSGGNYIVQPPQASGGSLASVMDKATLAVAGVSLGAKLGAFVDSTLYNINPDWWDANFPTINPQTWDSIAGQDAFGKFFINTLFGVDKTAYMPAEMLAYTYMLLRDKEVMQQGGSSATVDSDMSTSFPSWNEFSRPINFITTDAIYGYQYNTQGVPFREIKIATSTGSPANFFTTQVPGGTTYICISSNDGATLRYYYRPVGSSNWILSSYGSNVSKTLNNQTSYTSYFQIDTSDNDTYTQAPINTVSRNYSQTWQDMGWITVYGDVTIHPSDTGFSPMPDATYPDPSVITGTTVSDVISQLRQNYPDLFDGSVTITTPQDDGTLDDMEYVPVPWPTDQTLTTQNPTTGDATQDNTQINDQTLDDIILTTDNPNPPDTGTGNQSPFVAPTGSASSLWAVYHPSQAQLNAFGAWLWSSDFVEQLKRLFNDPMQAIIGVHKVFAPIPTGGSQNIKCGYLDSGVSSPVVSAQYTEVNCGTVNCREYFGNVFDYDPHTRVSIYLPFIGVVPLKVSEVMRASITVTYGVDVITGACLAKVKVDRDGGGAILYSFGGSCACHYPISAGSYAGIISGIVTSAVGVAGGIMSGNPLAAVGGVLAGARQAHTEVQHSGGFTGCAGAMGPKIPYLIITRPQTRVANDVQLYEGKPSNATQFIGDCTGFVRATEVHFSSQAAFDDEAKEVEALLKSGVLISD